MEQQLFCIYHFLFQYEEHVITISRESWENLMSRVLLLETKLELNNQPSKVRQVIFLFFFI